jgi:hypothetical protein
MPTISHVKEHTQIPSPGRVPEAFRFCVSRPTADGDKAVVAGEEFLRHLAFEGDAGTAVLCHRFSSKNSKARSICWCRVRLTFRLPDDALDQLSALANQGHAA